jgi:hypothetical protein
MTLNTSFVDSSLGPWIRCDCFKSFVRSIGLSSFTASCVDPEHQRKLEKIFSENRLEVCRDRSVKSIPSEFCQEAVFGFTWKVEQKEMQTLAPTLRHRSVAHLQPKRLPNKSFTKAPLATIHEELEFEPCEKKINSYSLKKEDSFYVKQVKTLSPRAFLNSIAEEDDGDISGAISLNKEMPSAQKFDKGHFYTKLGLRKFLEDLNAIEEDYAFSQAVAFLKENIHEKMGMSLKFYFTLHSLLTNRSITSCRTEKVRTKCYLPHEGGVMSFVSRKANDLHDVQRNEFERRGFGKILKQSNVVSLEGVFDLFDLEHLNVEVQERFQSAIEDFNLCMKIADTMPDDVAEAVRMKAIVFFFMRSEQLQPVAEGLRTNLALLNFLLAKHNLPCIIFDAEKIFSSGERASRFDIFDFDQLLLQIKQGMTAWCSEVKVDSSIV